MSVTLIREQELTKDNLNIYITDINGNFYSPYRITYTIYRVISDRFYNQECGEEPINETIDSVPLPFGIGKFFAPWIMPKDIILGKYRIKWNIKQYQDSPYFEEAEEFDIIGPGYGPDVCRTSNGASLNGGTPPLPHEQFQGGCAEGV